MKRSWRPLNNLDAVRKRPLLLRKYRNNLTQTPLISISYWVPRSIEAVILPISKPNAAFSGSHTLR